MLTNIRNAAAAGKTHALVPYSKLKLSIAGILMREGYLTAAAKRGKKAKKWIELELAYNDQKPKVRGIRRISKPSRRIYYGMRDIKPVKSGFGTLVLSTPKGILVGKEARKEQVGGEALFLIW